MKRPRKVVFKIHRGFRLRIVLFHKYCFYLVIGKGLDLSTMQ